MVDNDGNFKLLEQFRSKGIQGPWTDLSITIDYQERNLGRVNANKTTSVSNEEDADIEN
ncbi:MAG: hypothetical protein K2N80_00895 [Lachnospiraceae bacterium]|nr:hypothetical protein [Lachnospiraceae bacterium]